MKHTAPDGTILESLPYPQEVTYSCQCDMTSGLYEHIEGIGNIDRPHGLQIIKITRRVSVDGLMQISIIEYSEPEILEYIANANQTN